MIRYLALDHAHSYDAGNILSDSKVAPALQSQQRELAAAIRRDSIGKHLQHRPTPDELVKEGILQGILPVPGDPDIR